MKIMKQTKQLATSIQSLGKLLDNPETKIKAKNKITDYLLSLFKINGETALTAFAKGQRDIFEFIVWKENPRGASLAPTGYGKTEAVACAVLVRTAIMNDDFIIGSVKYGTSDIIMRALIDHIFDSPLFYTQLELEGENDFEALKRERRKSSLNFRKGGSLQILSFYGSDDNASLGIGKHTPNAILDESPLLSPTKYFQLIKILEGTGSYKTTFLFELGNALNRNHFMYNVTINPKYTKLNVSLEQAYAEGRLDPESVEQQRGQPFFNEFYLCKFPEEDEIDSNGYRALVTSELLQEKIKEVEPIGSPRLGIDVGAGGDYNVYVVRYQNIAWIESYNRSSDTMTNVSECERICEKYNIAYEDVFIDDIGVGRGVTDRLKEKGRRINSISVGNKAMEFTKFQNIKAENYWGAKMWLETEGNLKEDDNWKQITWIRYKTTSDKVIAIEPKDDLKKRTGKSPDFVEAFMLTFTKRLTPNVRFI